jgi:hypothetical protein
LIKDHVLLRSAGSLEEADSNMTGRLTPEIIGGIVGLIPDAWLVGSSPFGGNNQHRDAYAQYLLNRLEPPHLFLEEAIRARSLHI